MYETFPLLEEIISKAGQKKLINIINDTYGLQKEIGYIMYMPKLNKKPVKVTGDEFGVPFPISFLHGIYLNFHTHPYSTTVPKKTITGFKITDIQQAADFMRMHFSNVDLALYYRYIAMYDALGYMDNGIYHMTVFFPTKISKYDLKKYIDNMAHAGTIENLERISTQFHQLYTRTYILDM